MAPITDTHCHLVYRDVLRYPWLDLEPRLNRDFRLNAFRAEAEPLGISRILYMEVDVADGDIGKEVAFAAGLGLAGLVAACRPESPGFDEDLERAAANPAIKGFRRILHTKPDDFGLSAAFLENLRRIGRQGLPFDLCLRARQLPVGLAIAKACPDVQFILDHCGNPDVASRAVDPWRADIAALARLPNVACKVSGIVANAGSSAWTAEDLRPYVEHVIECFGWDRVVWGSDWPVCTLTADLTRWVGATRAIVTGAGDDERDRLFNRNAARIYRLS